MGGSRIMVAGKRLSLAPTSYGATHSNGDTPYRPGPPPTARKPVFLRSQGAAAWFPLPPKDRLALPALYWRFRLVTVCFAGQTPV